MLTDFLVFSFAVSVHLLFRCIWILWSHLHLFCERERERSSFCLSCSELEVGKFLLFTLLIGNSVLKWNFVHFVVCLWSSATWVFLECSDFQSLHKRLGVIATTSILFSRIVLLRFWFWSRSISSLERAPMFYNTCQLNCRVSWVKKALLLAVSKYYKRNSSRSQIVSCPDFYNLHLLAQYSFSSKKCHGYLVENNCKDFGYCSCVLVIELRDLREERIVRKLFRSRKRCFWEDRWRTRRYVCFYVLGSTTGVFEPAFAVLCFLRG